MLKRKIITTILLGFIILCAFIYSLYINWPIQKDEKIEVALNNIDVEREEERISYEEASEIEVIEHGEEQLQEEGDREYSYDETVAEEHAEGEIIQNDDHSGHAHEVNETEVLDVDMAAKDFELKTLDGNTVKLSDYKGKRVLLNFWATWCPPCREEMPAFQKYHEELAEKNNAAILAVNVTDQDFGMETIGEFVDYYELTFPILLDETGDVSKDYEILAIPTTFIIDENGQVSEQINGPLTNEMLQQLLGE